MQEALAVEGDEENDASENLMILDHKNVPISVYDPVRKVMVRKGGSVSLWLAFLSAVSACAQCLSAFECVGHCGSQV